MVRRLIGRSIGITCFALIGCGGGGGGSPTPTDTPPPPISFSHVFPQGDASATQGTAWDIVGVKTTLTGQSDSPTQLYDMLRVDVTFAQNISNALPLPGKFLSSPTGTELGVGIAFDVENNAIDGNLQSCALGSGLTPFEFSSDPGQEFGRLADGNYSILNYGGPIFLGGPNPPLEAVTSVQGDVITQSFFLPALSLNTGRTIPHIGLQVAALNGLNEFSTDCVPKKVLQIFTDQQTIE